MERSSYVQFDTASIDVFPEIDPKDGEYEVRQTVWPPRLVLSDFQRYWQIKNQIGLPGCSSTLGKNNTVRITISEALQ
jgi:hypothetical protein